MTSCKHVSNNVSSSWENMIWHWLYVLPIGFIHYRKYKNIITSHVKSEQFISY